MNNNIGFIGFGNMAQAITKGILIKESINKQRIFACAKHYDKLCKNASKMGINALQDAQAIVETCDYIIVAIKPFLVDEVLLPLKALLKHKVVISVVAGYDYQKYSTILDKETHHISTIPNTPMEVGEGICICEQMHNLTDDEYAVFNEIFSPISQLVVVDSKHFSLGGTMAGCTPAFVAMFIEALADAGVKYGLTRASSYEIAAQVFVGTGKLYLQSHKHPGIMKDEVCSPGGTTIKGVTSLEENGFRSAIIKAIDAIEGK